MTKVRVCPVCGFDVFCPVAQLPSATLGLYSDARYPGRCLLVYTGGHVGELDELPAVELAEFVGSLTAATAAVRQVTGAARVNVALLGNTLAHLHAHLIPRVPGGDPCPTRPIWEDPRPKRALNGDVSAALVGDLRAALGR